MAKTFTTLKLTSASSRASLTSLMPSLTSASVSLPLFLNFLKAFASLSVKPPNMDTSNSAPGCVM